MIARRPVANVWRSGCARGIDSLAAWIAVGIKADLELYIPGASHNEAMVKSLKPLASQVTMVPRGPSNALSYRRRNRHMVQKVDHLLAFVWQETFYRSGEWMTINLAKDYGVKVDLEVIPKEEW